MKRSHLGLATAFFAVAMVFATAAPAGAATTAGPYGSKDDCISARNEYNRYYTIESGCYHYALGGAWFFDYSK